MNTLYLLLNILTENKANLRAQQSFCLVGPAYVDRVLFFFFFLMSEVSKTDCMKLFHLNLLHWKLKFCL